MMNYVIIGASAAGLSAAEAIRKNDRNGKITILTEESFMPYSRPSVSYYLKGKVTKSGMFLRKPTFYKTHKIDVITNAKVTAIDTENKNVKAGRRTYGYDKLCLCTGSVPFIPHIDNAAGKENALTFLDLASVNDIKEKASDRTRAVVIGAGLIGMKAAEGLSKICKSVDVVELSDRVLPSILDRASSAGVKKHLENNGIKFHLGATVTKAVSKGKAVTDVILSSGKKLPCDLLILAVGVRPNISIAEKAGLCVNRGIVTDFMTMQTSNPDIYAAGDCCVSKDMLDGNEKVIALWPNAVLQGAVAGNRMAGGSETLGGSYSVNAIDFFGLRICTCGLINAEGKEYYDKIKRDGTAYKRLIFKGNNLVGFVLINSSENAGIYTSLISNRIDISTLEGDITDSPSLFLFSKNVRDTKLKGGVLL